MNIEITTTVAAPPEAVWALLADIEGWPSWTPTVTRVERLDEGPVVVGSRARITQPRQPTLEWVVTEWDEGRSFTWENRSPGVVGAGVHEVRPAAGGAEVLLAIRQRGPLAGITGLLFGRRVRRYVQTEADGLKAAAEASVAAA